MRRFRYLRYSLFLITLLGVVLMPSERASARPLTTALPDGFYEEQIVGGLLLPTSFAVAPDGRIFITEKGGKVRVAHRGVLQEEPFIDLSLEVNDSSDRGLMSVAVHPRFPSMPYVYLAYTYDPPEAAGYAAGGARVARVLRVEADRSNLNQHKEGTGVVILGANSTFEHIGNPELGDTLPFSCYDDNGGFVRDCLASEGTAHTIDFLKFARDGSLYVSMGDGIVNSAGNWRAQDPNSLNGKILRIDPLTGNGFANNPFSEGDLTANRAKVYALGLRNPFRFTFQPGSGTLYFGEVGNNTWEEINRGGKGSNYGWPCYEGEEKVSDWAICDPLFNGSAPVTWALYTYGHSALPPRGAAIGGDFYTGRSYPADYRGAYFFTDFNGGVIQAMLFSPDGSYVLREFATSAPGPIQISMGTDGNLWMLYLATGELVRLRYSTPGAESHPGATPALLPTATPAANSTAAVAPAAEGFLTHEIWTGIGGTKVDDLTAADGYPDNPTTRSTISSLNAPRNAGNDYGQRLRGYLTPPRSGTYRFFIASDDGSRLLLSTDDSPVNLQVIASVPEWTPYQVWDKYPEQASALLELQAGKRYYIEILHKQADQKDNLSVAWQTPDGKREVIEGAYLSPIP